jgi:hypothetical protein
MSLIGDWFKGSGAPAQRGQPAALQSYQANGPQVSADPQSVAPYYDPRQGFDVATEPQLKPWREWYSSQYGRARGAPSPFSAADHRPNDTVTHIVPYGVPIYKFTRRYDRGSAAYAFDSGRVTSNPIGAGIVFARQLPVFSKLIGAVVKGQGIFWNVQTLGAAGPELGILYSPQTLQALLGEPATAAVAYQVNPAAR